MASRSWAMQLQTISSISGFQRCWLTSAVPSDAKSQCTFSRTRRFWNFLYFKFANRHYQSYDMSFQKLSDERSGHTEALISERLKFLEEVSAKSDYSSFADFIDQEIVQEECADAHVVKEEFDLLVATARFSSISVGDASPVELYDEGRLRESQLRSLLHEQFPDYATRKWVEEAKEIASGAGSGTELGKDYSGKEAFEVAKSESLNAEAYLISVMDTSVKFIPDTTSRQWRQLEEAGFHTVRKLLNHFPRTYAELQNSPGKIDDGAYQILVGTISSSRAVATSSSLSFLHIIVNCESFDDSGASKKNIYLHLNKFFRGARFTCQPFLRSVQSKYKVGSLVYVSGKVKKLARNDHYEMREHKIDVFQESEKNLQILKRPYPLYPSKAGLKPQILMDTISRALTILSRDIDPMPNDILEEFNLPNLFDAYKGIHLPENLNEAAWARRRLNFDEFFYMQLGRLFQMLQPLGTLIEKKDLCEYKCNRLNVTPVEEWSTLTKSLLSALPYSLTSSQFTAISQIIWDLKRPVPMSRLLQGDVGCGKTVVAFLACMEVIASGFQAAIMAPSELVAIQHYEHLSSLLKNLEDHSRPTVVLLTGSTHSKQSKMIYEGLQNGDINMVIGTHSLIADKVHFPALRFTVIDEQQRFGVIQRGRFNSKLYSGSPTLRTTNTIVDELPEDKIYMAPHVLSMSATPIPRTFALAIYGDMYLTQITDLPPGRTPVETFILEGNETGYENVFQMMHDELVSGGRIYVVCPIINKSEQLPHLHAASTDLESLSNKFSMYNCGLLHGRMKSEEKNEVLKKFKSGETCILIATRVIEVGIDVPDASMMVVMNAERYGVAQLHQLRGRVGRGRQKSKCVFLSSTRAALNRLRLLEKSSDGFNLAFLDLLMRGPGNLLGKKQSGNLPDFPIARLDLDGNILREAHNAALKILSTSHDLSSFPKLQFELSMRQPLCILGD